MWQTLTVLGKQLGELWRRFGVNQKVSIILALLLCLAAVGGLLYWSSLPDFRLLYAGLDLRDAAAMREKLEEGQIKVQIREGGTALYVAAADVHRGRLLLAAEGLPRDTKAGFELFEQPKFGVNDFAQQINYQRALQGELERTLLTFNNIRGARVQLVLPKDKLFATEEERSARASIMLTLAQGATLPSSQVRAVSHLVASAVAGLSPSAITIVDQDGRLLSAAAGDDQDHVAQAGDQISLQRTLDAQLARNAQEILDRFLGRNRSIVKVTSEMDFSRVEKRNEIYDKDQRMVKSEKIIAESSSKPGSGLAGGPGTVVNTPVATPDLARVEQGQSKTKKENIQTEYVYPMGVESILQTGARIQRISVSVCVARGTEPRTPEQLKEIGDLIKAAVGCVNDPERGRMDVVEVKEMEFQPLPAPEGTPWWMRLPISVNTLVRNGGFLILLGVVYLVGRRILAAARVQSAEAGVPIRAVGAHPQPAEGALAEGKDVDVDLFETLQGVKEDPKKAAAWITRAIETG